MIETPVEAKIYRNFMVINIAIIRDRMRAKTKEIRKCEKVLPVEVVVCLKHLGGYSNGSYCINTCQLTISHNFC
jgi:hypothetical protein